MEIRISLSRASIIFITVESLGSFLLLKKFDRVALFKLLSQQNCSMVGYLVRISFFYCELQFVNLILRFPIHVGSIPFLRLGEVYCIKLLAMNITLK